MKIRNIFSPVLRIVAAAILLQTLYFKFTGQPESVELFTKLGVEPWGRIGTGVIELIAGILLLLPATVFIGAMSGIGLMTGAILSHLFVIGIESRGDGGQLFMLAIIVLVCCIVIAWMHRKQGVDLFERFFTKKSTRGMKAVAILFFCSLLPAHKIMAQGCSDAGFCTIGHLNQQQTDNENKRHQKISLLLSAGVGDESVFVFTPGLQYDNQFNKKWALQAKITANSANGDLGSAAGLGDIFLSGIYSLPSKNNWQLSFTAGTKLPLNQSDLKQDGRSLPMQYQSSLGTIDLITGITITNNQWQFAAGWQQPLTGRNKNHFLPAYWASETADKYIPSNDLNRRADVLLRAGYHFKLNTKFSFNAGLLGICHLGEDTYIDGNISNKPIAIKGSGGLTLNATALASYQLNDKITLSLTGAVPFIVRDVRPDGLTREFVVSPEISFNF
ncbi:DoxX family protein [Ferruginibacter sp. HRS2-29]|uniref:DoxX family protein n=1 Tax=Ferruginibacter sp. HRS2-29 TaxID=2487334 RepID=UPI0020CC40C8|nr:DoxX family protein [Ferruginibacter sp. HRS2-29]